jgi:heme exporter protein C
MEAKPRLLTLLTFAALALLAAATYMVFFYAPLERVMGEVQRVFYFHVASAWVGMLGFMAAAFAGGAYLVTKKRSWDTVSLAAVEISVVFLLIAIVTGSIWARPVWNTWWTWDPRLTTTTIMVLIYAAYLMLRQGIEDPDRRARFGAVYAILGFISVPLTFLSIRIWRTIHPVVIAGGGDSEAMGTFSMTPPMLQTFLFSLFVFSVIFITLMWYRIRLGKLADKVEQYKLQLLQ